ncbi:MAG: hypothetical protein IIC95_02380 [Chloroflexi bacterium]|nr:hypothetical protein [Chloroflexota bacterium]
MSTVDGGTDRVLSPVASPGAPGDGRPSDGAPERARAGSARPGGKLERLRRRTLTVSVEGAVLRAVAFSGSRIVAWATVDLDDPEGASLPPELAALTRGRTRQLTDLPFYASLVRYLEKPAASRRYLDQVVAVEVGNTIPFAPEEIDLRWKMIQDGRGPEVMAWAVPRWEIDAYIKLVGLMGVRPSASYAKALALSSAVGRSHAAIAHLTSSEAELVLVRDGVPRRVHRVELPPADATAYAGAPAQPIEELCASSGPDAGPGPTGVLPGQVPADAAHVQALADAFGERLRGPIPSIEAPDGFPALEYAANVGLMLADRDRPRLPWRASPAQQAVMDLLPPRHRRLRLPARAIGIALLFGALGAGAVAATSFVQQAESWAERQEASLAGVHRNVRIDNVAAAREKSMRLKLDVLAAQVQALEEEVRTSRDAVALVVERARALTGEPSVEVSDVSLAGGEVRVSGSAPSYRAVVAFADGLRATGLFEQLRTTSAAGTSREAGEAAGSGAGGIAFSMIGSYSSGADPDRDEAS